MKGSTAAKVGFVTLLAIVVLSGMIIWKGDVLLKAVGYELIGSFNNVGGLLEGSDVRFRGYKVGKVLKIIPGTADTKVYMNIAGDIKVPEGSALRVAFDGLIGQKFLEIMPGTSERALKPRSIMKGFSTLGLVDFIDVGTVNLEELKAILESVRKVTDDPETQRAIKDALINIEAATGQLNRFVANLNDVMKTQDFAKTLESLKQTSDVIISISKKLDGITEDIQKITADPDFANNIRDTAKEAKEAMVEVKNAASDIRKTLRKLAK